MEQMASRKTKRRHRLRVGRLILLILILLALIFGGLYLKYSSDLKARQSASESVDFIVDDGSTAKTVTSKLASEGIIRNAQSAYIYAKLNHYTDIKKGEYQLDKSWDVKTILVTLNDPNSAMANVASVTIVEGDWAKDIADKISQVTDVSSDDLLALWNDETYIRSIMSKYPFLTEDIFNDNVRISLEGYLAPDTYQFFKDSTAQAVTEKILDQTLAVYQEVQSEMASSSYSINEIYTMASIIQYESGKVSDMKEIAGVFYNRLKAGMPLQSSVTVCYAIDLDKVNDNWRSCEVNSDFESPYNTYKYTGLPPGPIENPGKDALIAALEPSSNDYYYFMADVCGDGTVYYAKTLEEHNQNVKKYLTDTSCLK